MRNLFVGFGIAALLVACAPSDVEASDYDQSCAIDDDCVSVTELRADGTDCSMGCSDFAINKKEKPRYDEDLNDARGKCRSMRAPFCETGGTPVCVQSRCTIRPG